MHLYAAGPNKKLRTRKNFFRGKWRYALELLDERTNPRRQQGYKTLTPLNFVPCSIPLRASDGALDLRGISNEKQDGRRLPYSDSTMNDVCMGGGVGIAQKRRFVSELNFCTWFGTISSSCCKTSLPRPAWVLLDYVLQTLVWVDCDGAGLFGIRHEEKKIFFSHMTGCHGYMKI